ncbi:uncharacterized protein LOC133792377 [Humulus lupulus]|uniref:uncharacterized protein LOC133792377 n=1 Tax=Humulus lupulus TaxID=3486 RepID=UPI002B40FA62|nr:uncharacterized protein LOC133792377 [Humulus lupulus]
MADILKTLVASNIQAQPHNQGKLPSQPVRNPRENANAITLRDGKTYDPPTNPSNDAPLPPTQSAQQDKKETPTTTLNPKPNIPTYVTTPPFPSLLGKMKKDEAEQEILETFCKVEVNIPLLNAIKQVPQYAKFLNELCTNKTKLKGNENVSVGENVSAVLQKKLPPKCKDPDTFTIACTIEMRVIIQLANRSNAYPRGVVDDVLVFLADFYILDMEDDSVPCSTPVLLGRPFSKTTRTKTDVHAGTLTMEFDGEVIRFNIFEAMRYPNDIHSVSSIYILDSLSLRILDLHR